MDGDPSCLTTTIMVRKIPSAATMYTTLTHALVTRLGVGSRPRSFWWLFWQCCSEWAIKRCNREPIRRRTTLIRRPRVWRRQLQRPRMFHRRRPRLRRQNQRRRLRPRLTLRRSNTKKTKREIASVENGSDLNAGAVFSRRSFREDLQEDFQEGFQARARCASLYSKAGSIGTR
jgi:hypothetical protein